MPNGTQPLLRYNESDKRWSEHSQYIDQSPGPRGNFTGGAVRGGNGTWVIGGTDPVGLAEDMVAWKHDGSRWTEHTLATSEAEPTQRKQHAIFDYSCGSSERVGVVGGLVGFGAGVATDETWLLSCANGSQDCAWTSVTVG